MPGQRIHRGHPVASEKFGFVPVKVVYHCEGGCKPTRDVREHDDSSPDKRSYFEQYDLGKIREIESKPIPHWYPAQDDDMKDDPILRGEWTAGHGVQNVTNSSPSGICGHSRRFVMRSARSKRLRSAMSLMFGLDRNDLEFEQDVSRERRMAGALPKDRIIFLRFSGRWLSHNGFDYKIESQLIPAFDELSEIDSWRLLYFYSVVNRSVCIPANSIDYIFTDPPYADKVQYGELNFVWEAWLGFDTSWHDEEIIVNEVRGKISRRLGGPDEAGDGRMLSGSEAGPLAEPLLSRHVRGNVGPGPGLHGRGRLRRGQDRFGSLHRCGTEVVQPAHCRQSHANGTWC